MQQPYSASSPSTPHAPPPHALTPVQSEQRFSNFFARLPLWLLARQVVESVNIAFWHHVLAPGTQSSLLLGNPLAPSPSPLLYTAVSCPGLATRTYVFRSTLAAYVVHSKTQYETLCYQRRGEERGQLQSVGGRLADLPRCSQVPRGL